MKQRKEELLREVQAEQAKVAALTKQRNIQIQKGKGRKASKTEVVVIPTDSKLASHVISPAASHVISSAAPTNQMLPQQMFASHQMQEALKVLQQDQQQTITQKAPGDKGPETSTKKSQKSSTKRKQKLLSSDLDIGHLQQLVIVPQQPGGQDSKATTMPIAEQMVPVPSTAEHPPSEMRRGSISRELDLLLQAAVSEEGNINLQEHKIIVTKQEDEQGMSQVPVVEVTPELADHEDAPLQIHITPEQSFEENQIHRFISPATIKSQQGKQATQEQPMQGIYKFMVYFLIHRFYSQ